MAADEIPLSEEADAAYDDLVKAVERYFSTATEGGISTGWLVFAVGQQPGDFGTGAFVHAQATPESQIYPMTLGILSLATEYIGED